VTTEIPLGCNAITMTETQVGRVVQLPAAIAGTLLLSEMPGSEKSLVDWIAGAEARDTDLIVNLAQRDELANISPEYLAYIDSNEGINISGFPIADFSVPVDIERFHTLVEEVVRRLRSGQCVIIHCRAGIGRSGLFAAALLTTLGISSNDVLLSVKNAGGRFETEAQRSFLEDYQVYLAENSLS
jgi:protein-tyrosine phosphatase